jgi:hypothetical protein
MDFFFTYFSSEGAEKNCWGLVILTWGRRGCIQRKTWCMDSMLVLTKNAPYLIVNSVLSYPTPTTKGKGWSGEDLSYWLSTFVPCLLMSKTRFFVNTNTEKGEGRSES